ncbi:MULTISPECIES: DUF4374 domain-containing protein [Sphingobacterium]|uniref:DUF4374 domain-containing protein n=1 Tax=Sphingobacterium anhuiense TaxID=493780 RepID=A0ABW5YWA0_9SPHI|nr:MULTISPECIES: DUF4374 domain-containing protein [Sphingobacterium]KKX49695.1 hypothetical protein L950_0214195 [Sphingobacterium sp. IITKGP-BTPF85]MCW2262954.1 hypothetical protein [Sphingobacterium kitahiroshimense]TCR12054.1 uncharacterized protein DUF4374 [Sphingobacterium sp. JUb78]
MNNTLKTVIAIAFLASTTVSCSDKDKIDLDTVKGNYVLAVSPVASTGVADYLLTAPDLESGRVTTAGQGVEQDGTYRYYVTHNNKFFSMLYGQGNPGAVAVYNLLDGRLNKLSDFVTETVQAFAPVNEDIVMMKITRAMTNPLVNYYRLNTDNLLLAGEGTINVQKVAGNGESAFFTWIKQVGNKVYAPYMSIQACCKAAFDTAYPDSAYVAVYSYPEMKLEKVIKDDRMSYIGRYFRDGLAVDEQGDVYAFSSAVATKGGAITSKKPSAILRIKSGTTEFDKGYYIDIEAISGGKNITNWIYVGKGKFVVQMTTKAEKGGYTDGKRIGILDVYNKTYQDVTGMPELSKIKEISYNNYTAKDGNAFIGVALTDAVSYVYKVNASTAVATQGLKVEGGSITAVTRIQ